MILSRRLMPLGLAIVLNSSHLPAQNIQVETCELPVVVTDYDNKTVQSLTPSDFSVRIDDAPTSVTTASIDAGPKRVAIILDGARSVPEEEWKWETHMAAELVKHARPNDQFALFVIGSVDTAATLSSSELSDRLQHLRANANERLYDALLSAAKRFDPPQFGDTIVLFGHPADSGSETSLDVLFDVMMKNEFRFYAMSFSDASLDFSGPDVGHSKLPGLLGLTAETGYYFSFHQTRALNMPGQLALLESYLSDVYSWISEPYRLLIPASAVKDKSKLEIEISDAEGKARRFSVRSTHTLYSCFNQAPNAPNGGRRKTNDHYHETDPLL
ncbi:MAG: hypothetical protein WBS24_01070 [Terriglobales bacterium]